MSSIPASGLGEDDLGDDLVVERGKLAATDVAPSEKPEIAELPRLGELPEPADAPLPTLPITERLVSLDAYRGLTMILMVSAGLQISRVVASFDKSPDLAHLKTPL